MNQTTHVNDSTWDETPDSESAPCSSRCYLPNKLFSFVVGGDDPDTAYTTENEAFQAMFCELVKRDDDYGESEWNYWRSKLAEHDRQILSMILETGSVGDERVLPPATLKLFVDHYNKCAVDGNRFRVITMDLCR